MSLNGRSVYGETIGKVVHPPPLLTELASDEVLSQAFLWLCEKRKDYSPHNEVWEVRRNWRRVKEEILEALLSGSYTFNPLQRHEFQDQSLEIWSATDSLVLKAMAIVLTRHLLPKIPKTITHLKGHGGAKAATTHLGDALKSDHEFVIKSDVASFYASINHTMLYEQMERLIPAEKEILRLIYQYMKRTISLGENYWEIERGISLGCPLSPLMAAVYLLPLAKAFSKLKVFYRIFMDDWVVLTKTRGRLKQAIRAMNEVLEKLKLEKAYEKTFIGRISKGFNFLGFQFEVSKERKKSDSSSDHSSSESRPVGEPQKEVTVTLSSKTLERFVLQISQRLARGASQESIERYVRRFRSWFKAHLRTTIFKY